MHESSAHAAAPRSSAPGTATSPRALRSSEGALIGTPVLRPSQLRPPLLRPPRLRPPLVLVWFVALALALVLLVGLAAPRVALAAAKKAKPAVTSISPAGGPTAGGTIVTISGRGLTSSGRSLVTRVEFGAKAATQVAADAQGRIVCTAPAGSKGTVHVVVSTRTGKSAEAAADRYTYKAPVVAPVISAFSFRGLHPAVTATISQTARTIALTVPYGTSVGRLVATFATTGAAVKVGRAVQKSGVTADDFTAPVRYTVTAPAAADAPAQTYTVTVTVAADPAKAITAFSIAGLDPVATGIIDQGLHTIALTVPHDTDVGALVATFATTGQSVSVGDVTQVSGVTPNDFSDDLVYTVTAADASTQDYTVVVTVAPAPVAIDSVSPASGELTLDTPMTITGRGFSGVIAVTVGGAPVADFSVVSDTEIVCTGPTYDCTGTVDVMVTTAAGCNDSSESDQFTFVPTVQSLSADSGGEDGGDLITITGAGFTGATEVDFGAGNPAGDVSVDSDSQITCTVPAWDPSGPELPYVTVTVPAGTSDGALDGVTYHYLRR